MADISVPKNKFVSKTFIGIGLASAACGAFCGFHDAMEIPLSNHLEKTLLVAPAVAQIFLGAIDGISLAKKGKQITGNYPYFMESEVIKTMGASEGTVISPEFHGYVVGAVGEAGQAVVEVAIGYGLGYLAGKIVRHFS